METLKTQKEINITIKESLEYTRKIEQDENLDYCEFTQDDMWKSAIEHYKRKEKEEIIKWVKELKRRTNQYFLFLTENDCIICCNLLIKIFNITQKELE